MKKMKVVLMMLLVFVLLFVTACNSSTGTTSQPEPAPPPANEAPPAEEPKAEPEPQPEEPVINMNGEQLKILHWVDGPNPDTPEGELQLAHWAEIEKKYNVDIVWEKVPWGESLTMVTNSALSGEAAADIVALDYYMAIPAIKDGLFMPIDGFFDFNDSKWPKGIAKYSTYKGKQYGFQSLNLYASGLYFNKTLLEREGLPNPHDLVAKGEWTWEKFLEIAKAATKDTNGDGITDQWGIVNQPTNMMRILIFSNGGNFIVENNGKFEFSADAKVMEALGFYDSLYNEHKVIKPPAAETWSSADYADSQTLFAAGQAAFVTGELWEGSQRTTMTDEQGFVYFPMGPQRTDSYQGSVENYQAFYIPANVKRAEEKAKIWEEAQMWDRFEQQKRENAELQMLSDERDIEVMMEMSDLSEPSYWPLGGVPTTLAYQIAYKGESAESIIEANKQVAQDALDAVYNAE